MKVDLHNKWVVLEPLLKPAMRLAPEEPHVLTHLLSGDAQLWGIYDEGKPVAAIVTGLLFNPKRCLIWLVGGSRVREWLGLFLEKLETYARALGCVALYAETPRKGWARIATEYGFKPGEPLNGFMTWQRSL